MRRGQEQQDRSRVEQQGHPQDKRTHPARTTDVRFLSELTKAQAACAALLSWRQFQGSSS